MIVYGLILFLIFACFFVFFIALLVVVIILARNNNKAVAESWQTLAGRYGLNFTNQPNQINGTYRGHLIKLDTYFHNRAGRRGSTSYTRLMLTVRNPNNYILSMQKRNVVLEIISQLGAPEVKTGYPELDNSLIIKSQPETFARRVLASPNLRQKVGYFVNGAQGGAAPFAGAAYVKPTYLHITLEGFSLKLIIPGMEKDIQQLEFILGLMADMAEEVERF